MQKQYIVQGHGSLKHDSTYYEPGQTVLMNEDVAAPLVAAGKLIAADGATSNAAAQKPDGFPDHSLDNKEPEIPPTDSEQTPPANGGQADAGQAGQSSPADPAHGQQANQTAPQAPANPTPEQIAKDMENA